MRYHQLPELVEGAAAVHIEFGPGNAPRAIQRVASFGNGRVGLQRKDSARAWR